jgi:biotin carboxylase
VEDERQLREVARTALLPEAFIRPFNDMLRAHTDYPLDASYLIVESLLEGLQVSLEGYVYRGQVHVLGILDAIMFPNSISFKRFQYPSQLSDAVQERMKEIARRFIGGIGYDNAPFNIELLYDPRTDRIYIIEVNPKIASQFADLFLRVDGQSSFSMLLELASGSRPSFTPRRGEFKLAASCVLRTFEDRRVAAIPTQAAIAGIVQRYPDARIEIHAVPGAALSNQRQDAQSFRYGLVNIGADSERELEEKFDAIAERLEFRLVPVGS